MTPTAKDEYKKKYKFYTEMFFRLKETGHTEEEIIPLIVHKAIGIQVERIRPFIVNSCPTRVKKYDKCFGSD